MEVAKRASALRDEGCLPRRCSVMPQLEDALAEYLTLDELLSQADVLSIHVPLNSATRKG